MHIPQIPQHTSAGCNISLYTAIYQQRYIQNASLHPGRTDHDSGHTKFERVCQFGCTDRAFGHTKS